MKNFIARLKVYGIYALELFGALILAALGIFISGLLAKSAWSLLMWGWKVF